MTKITLDEIYTCFLEHSNISIDSRTSQENSLFFALKGDTFDGNKFAMQALENGASFAIVDDDTLPNDDRLIKVEKVLVTLQKLAALHRNKMPAKVLAITGSNGKTTTKELCASVLSKKYDTIYTRGNLNNHIGVPLTLLRLKSTTEMAVIEMGANHVGEIRHLCQLASPHYGMITNIGKAHLEGFGSLTGVINAKSELYTYIDDHMGMLFVNLDNSLLHTLSRNINRFTYGKSVQADLYGELIALSPYLHLIWEHKGMQSQLETSMIGAYNLENILAAIAIGCYFGVDMDDIDEAVKSYIPINNRSQLLQTKNNRLVLDAYNANPVSMSEAIKSFEQFRNQKPLYILGDMLELGQDSNFEHAEILKQLSDMDAREVLLVGPEFANVYRGDDWLAFDNVNALCEYLKKKPVKGYDILIKASRGIQLEKVVEYL
jgi:UDP-N-acetylmuramoyl-tripeptide--D-alanyl-D-alanine ligase